VGFGPKSLMLRTLGRTVLQSIRTAGRFARFAGAGLRSVIGTRRLGRKFLTAVHELGFRCLPVVLAVAFFTGLVLALQLHHILVRFGAEELLGPAVALSLVRELGPVLTALMIVGQAGSALASELGHQRNAEQIDALETLRIPPLSFLVGPRLLAALVTFPMLTALFDLVGMLGGHVTCTLIVGFDPVLYWNTIRDAVDFKDAVHSLVKAVVFGVVTVTICCFRGFNVHLLESRAGVKGVSAGATSAVVWCSIAVLFFNFVLTALLLRL